MTDAKIDLRYVECSHLGRILLLICVCVQSMHTYNVCYIMPDKGAHFHYNGHIVCLSVVRFHSTRMQQQKLIKLDFTIYQHVLKGGYGIIIGVYVCIYISIYLCVYIIFVPQ